MVNRRTKRHSKRKTRRNINRSLRTSRKSKSLLNNAKTCVKNFSNYSLTNEQLIVLSKGMKFIPHRFIKQIKSNTIQAFNNLARNLRCKYELSDGNDYQKHPFYIHSNYRPKQASNAIESYIFHTKIEIGDMKLNKTNYNLSKEEWIALKQLKQNKNITIKVADKTKTIVVQNTSNYIKEGERQLSQIHYEQIDNPSTVDILKQVKEIIKNLHKEGLIDTMTNKFLNQNKSPTLGKMYLLPKLHKLPKIMPEITKPTDLTDLVIPSRPIISQCGSCTENIGRLADYFLLPLVQKQYTYLQDTKDFINKIEKIKCHENVVLANYDISSMYTNMTIPELLDAVERACTEAYDIQYTIPFIGREKMIRILKLQLENNEFECAGKYYKQKIGCSMGAVPSPQLSDLRAYEIIENILSKFPYRSHILAHFRFRDDGFILFDGNHDNLNLLFEIANKEHNLLKFTYNYSNEEITFLDTIVYKGNRYKKTGILDIKSYHKPTESYGYLHRSSSHYQKVFHGLVKGELIRQIRNNSDPNQRQKEVEHTKNMFLKRGYKSKEINKIITSTKTIRRKDTLKYNDKSSTDFPLVLITKYHSGIRGLSKVLRKYWHLIEKDEDAKLLFHRPPIVAFKRDKNLAQYVTSAKVHKN